MGKVTDRRRTGNLGEDIACIFLERKGFKVTDRNFSKPWGEIDIVATRADIVHFIEVKSISVRQFSRESDQRPEELVDERKLRKVSRTAALYMESSRDNREYQIDVVGVLLNKETRKARCRLYEQVLG